ncbi:MAG: hypothetical protein AVDCRST_MAG76-2331, partial [uncultured Acidimicrobiales bacterium]
GQPLVAPAGAGPPGQHVGEPPGVEEAGGAGCSVPHGEEKGVTGSPEADHGPQQVAVAAQLRLEPPERPQAGPSPDPAGVDEHHDGSRPRHLGPLLANGRACLV